MDNFKTKENIRDEFNISMATVNNWFKTGIIPLPLNKNYFNENEYNNIINLIKGSEFKLKGRANRSKIENSYITYLGITDEFRKKTLIDATTIHEDNGFEIEDSIFALSYNILKNNKFINDESLIQPKTKIDTFMKNWFLRIKNKNIISYYAKLNIDNLNDDFIGAFYQSIQSISAKSKLGSFYTPNELLFGIITQIDNKVLDPCCGSGNILMRILSRSHNPKNVFGSDIDDIAIKICKVNLALYFNDLNMESKIEKKDLIFDNDNLALDLFCNGNMDIKYDIIVTNPPWGSKYSKYEKDILIKKYPGISTSESFSIALYNSMKKLTPSGELIFFLPYSFLNVSTHKNIRKFIIDQNKKIKIYLLGNAFSGIMSESIKIHFNNNVNSDRIEIESKTNILSSIIYSEIREPDYIISATAENEDQLILAKILQLEHFYLKNQSNFALGIVTGNNNKHILKIPNEKTEPIFRGKDIELFKFLAPECFIEFSPNLYQQIGPVNYYRQVKIAYRFISDKLICVLDKENRLLLNSANLFIPKIDYPCETIVCLLNSKLYTFIYRKKYHSKKVLRAHIESLPIPKIDFNYHQKFKDIHDNFIKGRDCNFDLNCAVYKIFNFTEKEIEIIEKGFNKS